jgi:hypothetical protein
MAFKPFAVSAGAGQGLNWHASAQADRGAVVDHGSARVARDFVSVGAMTAVVLPEIQSVGAPHELHADRVVAAMMKYLAEKHAALWHEVDAITRGPHVRDGNPRAQAKLAARIKAAGATHMHLTAGKRGKYLLVIRDLIGWSPSADCPIVLGDELPAKPWLAMWYHEIHGHGHGSVSYTSSVSTMVSHHALSRTCQRWRVRTVPELVRVVETVEAATARYAQEADEKGGPDAWCDIPSKGVRYPVNSAATMVLQRHTKRKTLVVATILGRDLAQAA